MLDWLMRRAVRERRRGVDRGPRQRDALVVELLALTGLRASELAALEVRDVHLASRKSYLRVRRGKGRGPRDVDTVPLPWDTVPLLELWTKDRDVREPLVHAATSSRPLNRREVWVIVKRAVRGCRLREVLNAHSLRHFYGTTVAKLSKSSAQVQRLMRLRSRRMADVYTHLTLEDAADVAGPLRIPGLRRRR